MTPETLYLDLEHFALTTQNGPPLQPRSRVIPIGPPLRPLLAPESAPDPDEQ